MSIPNPLSNYYHDYHIRSETGQPLFVSASFTGCGIDPDHSHEVILLNSCPHKTIYLYLEIPPHYWESPRFNPATGTTSHIIWLDNIDIIALTGHDVAAITDEYTFSPLVAIYVQLPDRSPDLVYPIDYDPNIPVLRLCSAPQATHLFVKAPWCSSKTKSLEATAAFVAKIRQQYPEALYIHAVNTMLSCGADYWILPIKRHQDH